MSQTKTKTNYDIPLPPVWMPWTRKDLENLTLEEIEVIYANLDRKIYDIENQFIEETAFYKRNKEKILRKERQRKEQQLTNDF